MIEFSLLVWYRDALENNWIFHVMILNEEWTHFAKDFHFMSLPFVALPQELWFLLNRSHTHTFVLISCSSVWLLRDPWHLQVEPELRRKQTGGWSRQGPEILGMILCPSWRFAETFLPHVPLVPGSGVAARPSRAHHGLRGPGCELAAAWLQVLA